MSELLCQLKQHRTQAGLSQSELARHVGLSRQAVIAIEAGRQVPSTAVALQFARALGCAVEDLFALPAAPQLRASIAPGANQSTRVAVGCVDGQWTAHPVGDREPGDGLLIQTLGAGRSPEAMIEPLCNLSELESNVLVAGCAPLLGVLTGCLGRRRRDARATWIPSNSTRSLELLSKGLVHVAGLHLVDTETPGGHAEIVQQQFPKQATTIVNLTRWQQGIVVARGNPLAIREAKDLLRSDVRIVRREPGSGAEKLLRRLVPKGLNKKAANAPVVSSHSEVATLIRMGFADAGIAIGATAVAAGLDFIPLAEERFDLIVPRARLNTAPVATLIELIERPAFQSDARKIAGYDMSVSGHASTVSAG